MYYQYGKSGRVVFAEETAKAGICVKYKYSNGGRNVQAIKGNRKGDWKKSYHPSETFIYDDKGQLIYKQPCYLPAHSFTYDNNGNALTDTVGGDVERHANYYDANGNLSQQLLCHPCHGEISYYDAGQRYYRLIQVKREYVPHSAKTAESHCTVGIYADFLEE